MKNFVSSINNHHQEVALLLLKGCFISNESYKKLRLLLSFNLNQEQAVVPRCSLPKMTNSYQKPMYEVEVESRNTVFNLLGVRSSMQLLIKKMISKNWNGRKFTAR